MPKEKKDKDKKAKSSSKDDPPPTQVPALEVQHVSVIDTLASGYDTSSEGSAPDAQSSVTLLTAARIPSPSTPSEGVDSSRYALEAPTSPSKNKKSKDKKEKSKSKDKSKDKKKASPSLSPASSSHASTKESRTSTKFQPLLF